VREDRINLLPSSFRQAPRPMGAGRRYAIAVTISTAAVVLAWLYTGLEVSMARSQYAAACEQANATPPTKTKATELRHEIAQTEKALARYRRFASPLTVSDVIATAVNRIPAGVRLDRMDVFAGPLRSTRTHRGERKLSADAIPPRELRAELSGLAEDPMVIDELARRLRRHEPFADVKTTFGRGSSRETGRRFRLSFRIDLDVPYEVVANDADRLAIVGENDDR